MQPNKVVLQYNDGIIKKGSTSDFFPNKKQFHLTTLDGSIENVDVDQLKALFFVKDPEGDKNRKDNYDDVIAGGGRKMKVEFADGEVVIGYANSYSPDRHGFFLVPADLQGNNERIFIITSATNSVSFM